MSAFKLTDELLKRMNNDDYEFIVANFANPDMVGHSGNFQATVKAVETVDLCLGKILRSQLNKIISLIVTSDHGNADKMFDKKKLPCTTHTINNVPFIVLLRCKIFIQKNGKLADIAPTIKDFGIDKPEEMNGIALIK